MATPDPRSPQPEPAPPDPPPLPDPEPWPEPEPLPSPEPMPSPLPLPDPEPRPSIGSIHSPRPVAADADPRGNHAMDRLRGVDDVATEVVGTRDAVTLLQAFPDGWQRRRAADRLLEVAALHPLVPAASTARRLAQRVSRQR